jgi:hypothetical protein
MNHRLPDLRLLHAFGNEDVLLQKVAGGEALAARVAIGLMEANRSLNTRRREEVLSAQAEQMNHAFRMMEDQKMMPVREGARHARMPLILMALQAAHGGGAGMGMGMPMQGVPRQLMGEDVPLGMDEGMVRMASAIGSDLAHHALDVLDRMGEDAAYVKPCPFCGEVEKVEDTATNGTPRMTCKQCGKSWNPAEARNDGRPGPTH